jgi:FdhD protein
VPLTIFLNGEELVTLLCTGHHAEELALGFLRSEGLLASLGEVRGVQVDGEAGVVRVELHGEEALRRTLYLKRTLGSGCGRASLYYQPLDALQIRPIEHDLVVSPGEIRALMREMGRISFLYKESRGTHHAALALPDRILVGREDIGRHNAVDMIVGYALRTGVTMGDKILLTTGRASSEIVLKAARVGIPIVASRSASTHLAVEMAQRVGMTLVGSVRGDKMVLYAHPERVAKAQEAGP